MGEGKIKGWLVRGRERNWGMGEEGVAGVKKGEALGSGLHIYLE